MSAKYTTYTCKSKTRARALKVNLPLSLLDLTLQQARTLSTSAAVAGKTRSYAGSVRRAHASALAVKRPDVREGYLRPSQVSEKNGEERGLDGTRRPTSIAKGVRRTEKRPRPSTYAALLLNDKVKDLVRRTGRTELYAPGSSDTRLVEHNPESEIDSEELHLRYTESELRDVYTDLLAHPQSELEAQSHFRVKTKTKAKADEEEREMEKRRERKVVLESVKRRLFVDMDNDMNEDVGEAMRAEATLDGNVVVEKEKETLSKRLAARRKTEEAKEESQDEGDLLRTLQKRLDSDKLHHNILLRVVDVVRGVEDARKIVASSSSTAQSTLVTVLSAPEWDALVRTCVDTDEMDVTEDSILLMKRCGIEPAEEVVNDVLNVHAIRGDVPAVVSFFEKFAISEPTERQRDLHIKAHLKTPPSSASQNINITSALKVLHNYESLALLPPVQSYTRLICALFREKSAQYQAQAWDLFAHMRYVAHAKPDPALYALMIRACAGTGHSQSGYAADPVRALDLWTEMTTEAGYGYAPTVGAYNAVILACARSNEYVGEAFRLAREMLDAHRDAYGYPLMHATRETFDALLVAAKTRKDLPRARWILAEMLKIYEQGLREGVEADVQPDDRSVMHVFHAYTSYKPPFRRGDTAIVDEGDLKSTAEEDDAHVLSAPQKEIETIQPKARFSVTPPQTRQEVLAEAYTLFERILSETGLHPSSPAFNQSQGEENNASDESSSHPGPFSRVHLTPPLLNSYLSVHYMHDSLENSRKLYDEVFQRTGVDRSPRTYVEVLERCTRADKEERSFAKDFAEDVWREWLEVEKGLNPNSADARMIERAYAAMIRMFSLINDLDNSLSLLRTFTTSYPPHTISHPSQPKSDMRSTRVSLYGQRPLVRLMSPMDVQDDTVPPLLTPRDLELLHHRLVTAGSGRRKDLDWLTYLGHAYLGALKERRDRFVRG